MPAPKLFDTTQVDLAALTEKNRQLANENKRLRKLLRLARASVDDWVQYYHAKICRLNSKPSPCDYVSDAREYATEMEPYRKLLDAIDRKLCGQEGGDHAN
jgi:hypothetical protein